MSTDVSTDFVHVKFGDNIRLEQYVGGELAKFIPLTPEQAAYVGDVLHKPRTITTVADLDALPRLSVIRSDEGAVFERHTMWHEAGSRDLMYTLGIALPATVLYEPEADQ